MKHYSQLVLLLLFSASSLSLIIKEQTDTGATHTLKFTKSSGSSTNKIPKSRQLKQAKSGNEQEERKRDCMKANQVYQEKLKAALSNFRLAQEKVHTEFEKSYKKLLAKTDKENKKILIKSLHKYAKKIAKEDDHIREVSKHVFNMAHRKRNQYLFIKAEENEKKALATPPKFPKLDKIDPLDSDRK